MKRPAVCDSTDKGLLNLILDLAFVVFRFTGIVSQIKVKMAREN